MGERIDGRHDGRDRPPYQLHRLLGRRVVGSQVMAPACFALRFKGGECCGSSTTRHSTSRSRSGRAISSCEVSGPNQPLSLTATAGSWVPHSPAPAVGELGDSLRCSFVFARHGTRKGDRHVIRDQISSDVAPCRMLAARHDADGLRWWRDNFAGGGS